MNCNIRLKFGEDKSRNKALISFSCSLIMILKYENSNKPQGWNYKHILNIKETNEIYQFTDEPNILALYTDENLKVLKEQYNQITF